MCLSTHVLRAAQAQAGFMYSKDEMLQIYRDGNFKSQEFSDKLQQVPNATTPEFLIPLALLPSGALSRLCLPPHRCLLRVARDGDDADEEEVVVVDKVAGAS